MTVTCSLLESTMQATHCRSKLRFKTQKVSHEKLFVYLMSSRVE